MTPARPPSPEVVARLQEMAERPLGREEYAARAARVVSPEEREEMSALIAWFTRRYPTPRERLEYARRYAARIRRVHASETVDESAVRPHPAGGGSPLR